MSDERIARLREYTEGHGSWDGQGQKLALAALDSLEQELEHSVPEAALDSCEKYLDAKTIALNLTGEELRETRAEVERLRVLLGRAMDMGEPEIGFYDAPLAAEIRKSIGGVSE